MEDLAYDAGGNSRTARVSERKHNVCDIYGARGGPISVRQDVFGTRHPAIGVPATLDSWLAEMSFIAFVVSGDQSCFCVVGYCGCVWIDGNGWTNGITNWSRNLP